MSAWAYRILSHDADKPGTISMHIDDDMVRFERVAGGAL
jgi:hypothetical protein